VKAAAFHEIKDAAKRASFQLSANLGWPDSLELYNFQDQAVVINSFNCLLKIFMLLKYQCI